MVEAWAENSLLKLENLGLVLKSGIWVWIRLFLPLIGNEYNVLLFNIMLHGVPRFGVLPFPLLSPFSRGGFFITECLMMKIVLRGVALSSLGVAFASFNVALIYLLCILFFLAVHLSLAASCRMSPWLP